MKYLDRCRDECEMYIQESTNSTHHSCLRCREHGFIKWLSYDQYCELHPIMYPSIHVDKIL